MPIPELDFVGSRRAHRADLDRRSVGEELHHLAERLGFVARLANLLRLESTAVKGWLTAAPARQMAVLQAAWRDDPTWLDLCHVPGLICDGDTGWLERYDAVATRKAFLALLARCPVDGWWSLTSFVEAAKTAVKTCAAPRADTRSLAKASVRPDSRMSSISRTSRPFTSASMSRSTCTCPDERVAAR